MQTLAGPEIELTDGSELTVTVGVVRLHPVVAFVKVKVTFPEDNPVITPELVTVARALLLLIHVPPVVGVSVAVLPTQTEAGAVTIGNELIVTGEVLLLHPVVLLVKVKVTFPGDTPVITPAFVTVALAELLLVHVPPVVGERVAVLPTQTETGEVIAGEATTVTEGVVRLHPVVVLVKEKVTFPADTPVIKPAFVTIAIAVLLLVHAPPVVGERVAVLPTQTEEGEVTTGKTLTVIEVDVAAPEQPFPSVTVTE